MDIEQSCMQLILEASTAKSEAFEALRSAKAGHTDQAEDQLKAATTSLLKAHKIQTKLIQNDSQDRLGHIPLLLVHAQDHLMNAMAQKDLIEEMLDMVHKQRKLETMVQELAERSV